MSSLLTGRLSYFELFPTVLTAENIASSQIDFIVHFYALESLTILI